MSFSRSFLHCFLSTLVRPLQRQRVLVGTLLMLFLSNAWITERPSHDYGYYGLVASFDIYLLAALLELLSLMTKSGKRYALYRFVKCFVYLSAYILWSVEIFLFERFHLCISPTVVHLLLETSPAESSEFVEGLLSNEVFRKVFITTLSLASMSLIFEFWQHIPFRLLCQRLRPRRSRNLRKILRNFGLWCKVSKSKASEIKREDSSGDCDNKVQESRPTLPLWTNLFFACFSVFLCSAGIVWMNHQFKMLQFISNSQTEHAESVAESEFFTPYYRSVQALHLVRMAAHETEVLKARMQHLPVLNVAEKSCPNIVVIIGESYNKHHAALYGYGLPTTPRLSERAKRGELIVFDDVISPWNITSNAFRAFLSTQSADEGGRWTEGVLFPALFKRAGFKVAFLSNQFFHTVSQGSIDFNGSFFLNDTQMENLCFDHRNVFRSKNDGTILSLLKGFTPGERNLYLFHLWGQHMEYDHRYPSDQTTFTHHDIPRPDLSKSQRETVAHYDNATRWNDEVVDRILRNFANEDAVVVYFSDHGEEVYDGSISLYGRIHDEQPSAEVIRHEYEVPFMIWGSRKFRRLHPGLFERIQTAQHHPFSHDDLPHLLLGLAGIKTAYYKAHRDPLSPKFRPQRRLLRGNINYDEVMRSSRP